MHARLTHWALPMLPKMSDCPHSSQHSYGGSSLLLHIFLPVTAEATELLGLMPWNTDLAARDTKVVLPAMLARFYGTCCAARSILTGADCTPCCQLPLPG